MTRTALTDFASVTPIIAQLRLFGGTTDAQLATIFRRLELWTLQTGDLVFRKGDEPLHIYIVRSGRIDLRIEENDVVIRKHEIHVGECFGEASLLSMHQHTSTASAAGESEIIALSRRALIELNHDDPRLFGLLMMNLARELARRLYLTDQMLLAATAQKSRLPQGEPEPHWS